MTLFYIVCIFYYILLLYWILYMWYHINIWIDLHVCCTTSFSQDDSGLAEAGQWAVLAQHLSHCVLWVPPPPPRPKKYCILIISNIARAGLTWMTKWTSSVTIKLTKIKTIHSYQTVFTCRCMVAMVTLYRLVISHIYSLVSSVSVYIFNMPLLFEQLVMSKSNWSCVWEKYIETIRCWKKIWNYYLYNVIVFISFWIHFCFNIFSYNFSFRIFNILCLLYFYLTLIYFYYSFTNCSNYISADLFQLVVCGQYFKFLFKFFYLKCILYKLDFN